MKNYLFTFILFLFSCANIQGKREVASPIGSRGEGSIGNGGGACVCRDSKDKSKITFAELIDITEAKAKGLEILNIENLNTYDALAKLFQNYPKAQKFISEELLKIKKTPLQNSEKFDLNDTADYSGEKENATSNSCSKYYYKDNCQYEQVANFKDDRNELVYSEEIYSKFNNTSKLALDLHEYTYLQDRLVNNETLSDRTKSAIGDLLSGNPQRVLKIVKIKDVNVNSFLSDFLDRYENDNSLFNKIYDAALAKKIDLINKKTYEEKEFPNILEKLSFIKEINIGNLKNYNAGLYYDFNDKDELSIKIAYNRILEMFLTASVEFTNFRIATQFGFDNKKYFKTAIDILATIDETLTQAMLSCSTVACVKHIYDAQREILDIGFKIDKLGFNGSAPFDFNHAISSTIVKIVLNDLNKNMREQTNYDRIVKKSIQVFLNSAALDINLGNDLFNFLTIGVDKNLYKNMKIEPSNASLANEIKVLQYLSTRLQYSIMHNVPLSHSPSAFDSKRRYGVILKCSITPNSITGWMAGFYGPMPDLKCEDLIYNSEKFKKHWQNALDKNPNLNIETVADDWIKKYTKGTMSFANPRELEFTNKYPEYRYKGTMVVIGFGLAVFDMSKASKALLMMIASARPLDFNRTLKYVGPVAGAGIGVGAEAGVLFGLNDESIGSIMLYGGGSLGLVGAYAGLGYIDLTFDRSNDVNKYTLRFDK